MPKRPRLIVVANRLPVSRAGSSGKWQSSAGGLVTALAPILRSGNGTWVGWTGSAGVAPKPFTHDGLSITPVPLSAGEIEHYYHGLCNQTLWPLYHDAIRTPEFQRQWWWPYVDVNTRFAHAVAEIAARRDTVWVHDYHLQLVPRLLRDMRPDLRVGFFLHTPFPPEELFAWLPWRRQILDGLLGADLVGFQTFSSARNFSRAARAYTAAEGTDTRLTVNGGRTVRVNAFPISIDTGWFERQAQDPTTIAEADLIRRRVGPERKILLGIDRLDYTKGIEQRLMAYEELLQRKAISVDDCVLMQIATPSREVVGEYAETRTHLEQAVGRINGEFGMPGAVAVHYFRRNFTREQLVAFYRAADVMLVTPFRDGMNLVAKEYVACRADGGGVLVLSEFAGAAQEFRRALLVNPRDIEGMANTVHAALTLPRAEARHRMAILRMIVRRHNVHDWSGSFMEALAAH